VDYVDLPVTDILFLSIVVFANALDTILEASEEGISSDLAVSNPDGTITKHDLGNIISPPMLIEWEMESAGVIESPVLSNCFDNVGVLAGTPVQGTNTPVVTQDNPRGNEPYGDSVCSCSRQHYQ
jgi:hypothetical protein